MTACATAPDLWFPVEPAPATRRVVAMQLDEWGAVRLDLAAGRVHVWRVELDRSESRVAALRELLDEPERRRAAAFARERDRTWFVVAHAALRQVLGRYVGAPAASLRFVEGVNGKPALATPSPHFNLSHSDGLALIAVAAGRPVGVDVERVRRDFDVDGLARRWFGAVEREPLLRSGGGERRMRFFRLWTCKESCVKAGGAGLGTLERTEISFERGGRASSGGWRIAELRPAEGFVGAVAVPAHSGPLDPVMVDYDNNVRIDRVPG